MTTAMFVDVPEHNHCGAVIDALVGGNSERLLNFPPEGFNALG
jgi:hypothetical protein